MGAKNDDRKSVVVVGGGAGGSLTARALSKSLDASKFDLIVIDPRPNIILPPPTVRLPVINPDGLEDKVLVPIKGIFINNNGTFLQGEVISIVKGEAGGDVVLDNQERIHYDVLVLSPGSIWYPLFAFASDVTKQRESWATSRASVKAAQNIVLVGAGAVGLELAGEIKSEYPHKSVTIVQGADYVLNKAYPDRYRKAVEASLASKKINLIANEHVDNLEISEGEIKTRKGTSIKADLVISTIGTKPNTEFIAKSLGANTLSTSGYVKVQPTLQLPNHANIFAVGDIIDFPEQKQLMKTQAHSAIVAANVLAFLQGKPLKSYKGQAELIIVTLGKEGGVAYIGYFWGIILGDWFARLVKSKTLLVEPLRKAFGLE